MAQITAELEQGLLHATTTQSDWKLDPTHAHGGFSVRHIISRVNGTFTPVDGELHIGAEDYSGSSVRVSLDAASVNTGNPDRDAHLRSADFFALDAHPTIDFAGDEFVRTGEDTFDIHGQLTIRGITKPVVLHVEDTGRGNDPWGGVRAGFHARTEINRHDFGVNWNLAVEAGGMMLGEKVAITLDAEFVRQ